jgi:hypothetical protein
LASTSSDSVTQDLPEQAASASTRRIAPPPRHVIVALIVTVAAGLFTWALFGDLEASVITARRDQILPVVLGAAVILLALPRKLLPWGIGVTAVVWTLAHLGVAVLPDVIHLRTPVDQAVGGAAFTGTEYQTPQLGLALATLLPLLAAGAAAIVLARREQAPAVDVPAGDDAGGDQPEPGTRRGLPWVVAGLTALLAIVLVPDMNITSWAAGGLTAGWDAENLIGWDWAASRGLVPMKDYFFPYAETWVFGVFPWGPLWEWLARSATLGFAAWALWQLGPREGRATRAVLGVALLVVLGVYSPYYWRYALGVVFVAAYAGIGPAARRRPGRDHLILTAGATFIGFYDVGVLGQTVVGCVFVVLADLIARRLSVRRSIRGLAVDALPFVVAGGAMLALWALRGSLEGNLRWWVGARAVSAASAPDEQTLGALTNHIALRPTLDMIYIGAPFLLLAAGIAHLFSRDRRSVAVSRFCMGAAGVGIVFLLKHMVRPQSSLTLIGPLLALGWAAIVVWNPRRLVGAAAAGAFVAALLFSLESGMGLHKLHDQITGVPGRIDRSIALASDHRRAQAESRRRFDPAAYTPATTPEIGLATILRDQMASSPRHTFAVLGDAQGLYYFLDQPPPYHTQLYNAAPEAEQKAMVDALARQDPQFLFYRRDVAIDGVPPQVRAPLVHLYAIDNYVPARPYRELTSQLGYDILVRRRTDQPIPVDWWRSRLGDLQDLGFVPYSSNGDEAPACDGGSGCVPYVIVKRAGGADSQAAVTLSAAGRTWRVLFATNGDEDTYAIRLDRLWFSPFLGTSPTVASGTPGWNARLERVRAGDALY